MHNPTVLQRLFVIFSTFWTAPEYPVSVCDCADLGGTERRLRHLRYTGPDRSELVRAGPGQPGLRSVRTKLGPPRQQTPTKNKGFLWEALWPPHRQCPKTPSGERICILGSSSYGFYCKNTIEFLSCKKERNLTRFDYWNYFISYQVQPKIFTSNIVRCFCYFFAVLI